MTMEHRVEVLTGLIDEFVREYPRRCYLRPAKINGYPTGYCGAMTYRIINVKRRKGKMKTLKIIVLFFMFIMVGGGYLVADAAEVTTERRVEWEQDQETFDSMDHWELLMGDAPGGPYVKVTDIGKPTSPPTGGIYVLEPVEITVTGQMGKTVTKYFVMEAVTADGVRSGFSNEALSDFKIALGVPFTLKMSVITKGE
jgi:hypothetical protein